MTEKDNLSQYDDLINSIVEEAGAEEEFSAEKKSIPTEDTTATVDEIVVDDFVNSVVEEAGLAEPDEELEGEQEEEDEPKHIKRSLADFPDAKYKVISYNDKSDHKAFYLYSMLGRYPQFPILLTLAVAVISVWFAYSNNRQDLLQASLMYMLLFVVAGVAFFWLRINNIVKKLGKKDERALETARVEVAFYEDHLVLIKYGFDIKMDYDRLEHYGKMGDRAYLYFDNSKALLLHTDDFEPNTLKAVEAMLKQVIADNKASLKEKKSAK